MAYCLENAKYQVWSDGFAVKELPVFEEIQVPVTHIKPTVTSGLENQRPSGFGRHLNSLAQSHRHKIIHIIKHKDKYLKCEIRGKWRGIINHCILNEQNLPKK